jgi:hypothetical protein
MQEPYRKGDSDTILTSSLAGPRISPFQDSKLLPEGEIFQEKITARTKEYDNRNGQELHQTQHQSSIPRKHGSLDTGSFG